MNRRKTTTELLNEIKRGNNVNSFCDRNIDEFRELSLSECLNEMLSKYGVKKSELFRKAGLDGNNYAYELFRDDSKTPSRDVIIRLCLAFSADIDETQRALRAAGEAPLYPRDKRDVYTMYALKNRQTLDELNETLSAKGLRILE